MKTRHFRHIWHGLALFILIKVFFFQFFHIFIIFRGNYLQALTCLKKTRSRTRCVWGVLCDLCPAAGLDHRAWTPHRESMTINGRAMKPRYTNTLRRGLVQKYGTGFFFLVFLCFTNYFVFSIAVLPHSPGVVYYHLLLRGETRIPGVGPFSFRIGIWDLFVHRGQKSHTPTAFGKLWTTPGVRCMKHASS